MRLTMIMSTSSFVCVKCVCETIDPNISPADVDAFIPTVATPSICISTEKTTSEYEEQYAVPCEGFGRTPNALGLEEYGYEGINQTFMDTTAGKERQGRKHMLQLSSALYQVGAR